MNKTNQSKIDKILEYILLRRPDEFLLVPDTNGYYSFKEVLKAISEKKDLSWITKGKIISCINLGQSPLIELGEPGLIKAVKSDKIPFPQKTESLPGEIYTCIRKKAWPHVYEKGLNYKNKKIICFSSKEKALIKGRRIDPEPVLLHVSTKIALSKGIGFEKFMEDIFLAEKLEPEMFKGPSTEKTIQKLKKKKTVKKESFNPPGSFSVNPENVFPELKPMTKDSWKRNKKKLRRQKKNLWPDEIQ
ncbi:MAG: RNA 2'-phosphotransferase [Desulforegulaceae bacterium]|nr:RNA 2'-phosphotransferase [Desulforegulaceae bacterium]